MAHPLRVFSPGDVLDGYVLQDGDCPFSDTDPIYLNPDDGGQEGSTFCGFADGDRICCAHSVYTAWLSGAPDFLPSTRTTPVALCIGHGEVVRQWPELVQMHTVRPAGTTASWREAAV